MIADFIHPQDPSLKYPFVKNELRDPKILIDELFSEFINGKQDYDPVKNIFYRDYLKSWQIDSISCHYTENVRVKCSQNKKPTYVQIWKSLSPEILRGFKTVDEAREYMRTKKGGAECGYFHPSLALRLYLGFNDSRLPIKVIDPSAGWGDRMIAAIAAGDYISQYDGYDPNKDLIEPYKRIIADLDYSKKCTIFTEPFEKANVPKDYYDVGMTSPPYFDLEIYSEDTSQSVSGDKINYPTWLNTFYEPYLLNLAYAVKPGGKVIVYVSDYTTPEKKTIDLEYQTNRILKTRCKFIKKGEYKSLPDNGKKHGRPFFIFEKL